MGHFSIDKYFKYYTVLFDIEKLWRYNAKHNDIR